MEYRRPWWADDKEELNHIWVFLKDMPPTPQLSYDRHSFGQNMLVFSTNQTQQQDHFSSSGRALKERIRSALLSITTGPKDSGPNILIQFWAPTTGVRPVLKTTNHHPFALRRMDPVLCNYRKHCMSLAFNVNENENDDDEEFGGGGGIIGRVFRHRQMESTPDIEYYSVQEYPQRDIALKFGVRGCLALPVLEPADGSCYGVLELVDCPCDLFDYFSHTHLYQAAKYIIKGEYLKTYLPLELQIERGIEDRVLIEEINRALQVVCTSHQLPLAQIWIPCQPSNAMDFVDSSEKSCYSSYHLCCTNAFSSKCLSADQVGFNDSCSYNYLQKGQGIVGRALLYHKPCFCRDVSQLPITEYPLSHYARNYGYAGCFAMCLHSPLNKNHDYVLEFFLPLGDPRTLLESLFATVKKHLQYFEICSGGGPGEELCIEVFKISMNDKEDSFRICQSNGIQPIPESLQNEREEVQNKVIGEAVIIDNGSNVLCAEQNDVALADIAHMLTAEVTVEVAQPATNDEITSIVPITPENEREVVQLSDEDSSAETVLPNELEKEYRTTDTSLSREDLVKHFGMKQDDAAKILGISRSTMKRACRVHGIQKWPFPKRKKLKSSPSNLKRINKFVQRVDERVPEFGKREASCSDPPPVHPMGVVAHTKPSVTPKQDTGSVTVKATYGDEIIRFQLPFSSTRMDLVEKVTKRLLLKDGTFNIKYEDDDGDWVLIACDEDLEECMGTLKSNYIIKMSVQPIINQAP